MRVCLCLCVFTCGACTYFYVRAVCERMCTRVCPGVCMCVHAGAGKYSAESPSSFGEALKFLCGHRCPALEVRGPGGSTASGHHLPCADEVRGGGPPALVSAASCSPLYGSNEAGYSGRRGAHISPFLGSSRGWAESEAAGRGLCENRRHPSPRGYSVPGWGISPCFPALGAPP